MIEVLGWNRRKWIHRHCRIENDWPQDYRWGKVWKGSVKYKARVGIPVPKNMTSSPVEVENAELGADCKEKKGQFEEYWGLRYYWNIQIKMPCGHMKTPKKEQSKWQDEN